MLKSYTGMLCLQ